jgi:hypothetical protein
VPRAGRLACAGRSCASVVALAPREHRRASAERIAINQMASKTAMAQARGWVVAVTLRERPPRKVRGVISARRIDKRRRLTGREGESNLLVVIGDEEIPLEKISEIARAKVDP